MAAIVPPVSTGDVVELQADELRTTYQDGSPVRTLARGNVLVKLRDMSVTSESCQVDHPSQTAEFGGNVLLRFDDQEVHGASLTLNLRTRFWNLDTASAKIEPGTTKGYLVEPLTTAGSRAEGEPDKLTVFRSSATTCLLDHPHYDFTAKSMVIYPDNKVVLRDVTMHALDRRLFRLPRVVLPIRDIDRDPRLIPQVGQSAEEGYYLKTAFSYMGTRTQTGLLLLDFMTRKGVGEGLSHKWDSEKSKGMLEFYHIFDKSISQDTYTGRLNHNQQLGTLRTNVSTDFRSNSYLYAPRSKSMIQQISVSRDRPGANSGLNISRNTNDAFSKTVQLSGTLRHRQSFGLGTSGETSFGFSDYSSGMGHMRKLTSELRFSSDAKKFLWKLSTRKLSDLSDDAFIGTGRFSGIETLPELELSTDDGRLGGTLPLGLPFSTRLTYGKYAELPYETRLDRSSFELTSYPDVQRVTRSWTFDKSIGFRQYFYSDQTAQYNVSASAELRKRLGEKSHFGLSYRHERPRGYSPFRFDFLSRYRTADMFVDLKDDDRFSMRLATGYNIEDQDYPWQDITFRSNWKPFNALLLYTSTGYDLNQGRWRSVVNQIRVRSDNGFRLDIGTRYDPVRHKWSNVKTQLDVPVSDRTKLQAMMGYNGFSGTWEYRNLAITRDLHCWEASLVFMDQRGFYNNQSVTLNFRIKAFPAFQTVGNGAFGQMLDTSVGEVY